VGFSCPSFGSTFLAHSTFFSHSGEVVATVLLVCERRVWAAVRLSAYVNLAPAGGPSALAVPTAAFGADAHVAEAFAAGILPPIIPSLGCGPFWTVLVWKVEPVFIISMGFLRVPVSVFFIKFLS